jgi:geranylgeranyl transferase type-2 subunit beta
LSYLTELTLKLALGASRLDEETRQRHRHWLQSQQREDGGFAGREGESDPYYTAFGLRGLLIVDGIDETVAKRSAAFVRSQLNARLGVVDLISLVMAAAILEIVGEGQEIAEIRESSDRVTASLCSLRSRDGGYAKTPGGVAGSTYQTFLNLLCWELIGCQESEPDSVVSFLQSQRQLDGGFREIRVAKRAGVNPTAAGIGALKALGRLQPESELSTVEFLSDMQTDEGGLAANDRIPFPDLLSSCTGLVSLVDLNAVDRIDIGKLLRYARRMERREDALGGFHGFEFDQETDVEYTFYGLSCLALGELALGELAKGESTPS